MPSFLNKLAKRGNPLESPSVPLASLANAPGWFITWANGLPTDSGEMVTPLTALQVITVVACVKVIAEGVGQLPIQILERLSRGLRVAREHGLYDMLSSEWNPEMTAITAMEVALVHALLWGNSYTEIQRDNANRPIALWPRKPWEMQPKRDPQGNLVYECRETGTPRIIAAADMIHVLGLSLDGWLGQETVQHARQAIGLAMALERHAARFFGNGAQTTGTMEVPGELSDKSFQRLKESVDAQSSGANKFRAMILEGGTKWNSISTPNDQAQFIESRKLQRSEIASLFRCPLHMIASDESRGVKSNTEQVSQEFITFTLQPWLTKFQQEINRKLFTSVGRSANKYEVRFHVQTLMAADSAGRIAYYTGLRNAGILTANECRLDEGLEPVGPEGDLLMVPLNMIPASQLLSQEGNPDPLTGQDSEDEQDARSLPLLPRLIRAYSPLFEDGFSRLSHRSKRDIASIRQCLQPSLEAVSSSLRDMLATQERLEIADKDSKRAIDKYLSGLASRTESMDAKAELTRALKSLTHAAYRDLAEAQAKTALKDTENEDTTDTAE